MWASQGMVALTRLLVGAHAQGEPPSPLKSIYFANHSSHVDTLALWSALPDEIRQRTSPVAAKDYWGKGSLRGYLAVQVLKAVLIDRSGSGEGQDPLAPLADALSAGRSLILFPEGTRQAQSLPGEFRSGLYHLASRFPDVQLQPVYLENLHRVMPKGAWFPVPLYCAVRFGQVLNLEIGESKSEFLARARRAIIDLA